MHEETISTETVYKGRILDLEVMQVKVHNGRQSVREIIHHSDAIAVLAELPDGRYVFVNQFRKPLENTLLEIVAGGIEEGETPEESAIREVAEETGYRVDKLVKLGEIWACPGYCDELLHLFYAQLDPTQGDQDPDEDEVIEVVTISEKDFTRMISEGRIFDAKTLAAWSIWSAKKSNGGESA